MLDNKKIGIVGEEIAIKFLLSKDYKIVEQNYAKLPFGEIDVVVKKKKRIFFVEVKTTSHNFGEYSPKDHFDKYKLKKFERISEIYLNEKKLESIKYSFLLILVFLDLENKKAQVELIDDLS